MIELGNSVASKLKKACEVVAESAGDLFWLDVIGFIEDHNIESPIEQRFYIALQAAIALEPAIFESDIITLKSGEFINGVSVYPQKEIGKYRVDFLIERCWVARGPSQESRSIIVECDSQQWHERPEPERRYEKARDRFLVSQGYRVFHYTGKEVCERPFICVEEVLDFLWGEDTFDAAEWDNIQTAGH